MKKALSHATSHIISFCLIVTIAATALVVATRSSWAANAYSTIKSWAATPQKKEAPLVGEVTLTATAGTAAGSFTTLKEAFDAINAGTHQGVIAISINANTTEAASAVLNASGSGSASYTSISIQPAGGAARTISGAIAAGSPLIDFNGADNVTIDGLNTGGNSLTISNTTASATSGTSTIRFIGGATSNTITNSNLQGSVSSSVATNGAIVFFSTDAVTANGNDNNTISNNNIGPAGANLPTKAILGNGSTTTTAIGNSGIIIDNNNIFDFFGAAVTSAGIATNGGCNTWTITNNRFYQTATRTWTTGALHTPINIGPTTATSGAQAFTITGNIIGFASNTQTGTYTLTGNVTATRFIGILFNGISTGTTTTVSNNTVAAVSMTGVQGSGTSTSTPFTGILFQEGNGITNGNTIGSQSATGSLTFSTTTTSNTDVYGIYNFSSNAWTSNSNNIGGISVTNLGASGTFVLYGMRAFTASTTTWTATSNNVGGTVANSIQLNATGTASQVIGMFTSNCPLLLTSNGVRNLTSNIGTGTTTTASVIGIVQTSTTPNSTLSQNKIFNLTNTNATAASVVTGIQFTGSTANLVERNLIYGLTAATNSTAAEINGIRVGGGTTAYRNNMIAVGAGVANAIGTGSTTGGVNGITEPAGTDTFFHNSVYIGGSPTAGVGPSYAFNSSVTTNTRSFRDNIFFNARNNSGATGKNYAVRVGGTTPNPTGLTINNNVYFANGAGAVFGFFNALDVANLAAWKTAVGQDANSFESDPKYLDPTNATPDLHINPSVSTVVEGNGADVGVTDDFDGQTRSGLTPVDIGADAGNFMGIDLAPPVISYTALGNTTSTSNRGLAATITDAVSGVPTSGVGLPVIYFRKGMAGAFSSTQSTFGGGSTYNFTINYSLVSGGSVMIGDIIQYYVVAQDGAATPNVTSNPAAGASGYTANPPAAATPPTTPNSYMISAAINGTKTVCASGCDYTTLTGATGAFNAINTGVATGNIEIQIAGDLIVGEDGTNGLNALSEEPAGSNFTVKIYPTGSPRAITGSFNGALIRLNGSSRVTIDGSIGGTGTDRSLTIQNTSVTTPSVVLLGSTGTTPITNDTLKNCVIRNGVNTSSAVVISDAGTLGNAGFFSNITVQNNDIQKAFVGVFATGGTTPQNGSNLTYTQNTVNTSGANAVRAVALYMQGVNGATVSQNTVGNLDKTNDENDVGIWLASGTINATVSGNTVTALGYTGANAFAPIGINVTPAVAATNNNVTGNSVSDISTAGGTQVRGISVSGASADLTIQKNNVQGIINSSTNTFGAYGIDISAGNNIVVKNNFVSNVSFNMTSGAAFSTTFGVFGIRVGSGNGIQVYNNSVNLYGPLPGTANTSLLSAAFALVSTTSTGCDVRNNIFANNITGGTTSIAHVSAYLPSAGTAAMNLTWNNNAYYFGTDASRQGVGQAGTTAGTNFFTTLAALAAYSSTLSPAATNDNASLAFTSAVPFLSNNDLHLPATAGAILGGGTPLGSVTNDYDMDPRPVANPDIGADELVQATAGSFAAGTYYNMSANDGDTLSGNVTVTNMLTLNGKLSTGANTLTIDCNASISGAGAGNYVIGNLKKTYCSAGNFNFVVGTANGFSPVAVNVTAGTFPADFTVKAVQGPQPNIATPTRALQRYWVLTATGVTADLTFNYLDPTDIPAGATEANFVIFKYNGTFTMPGGSVNPAANTATITGVSSFSDWTLAEPNAPTDIALKGFTVEGLAASPSAPQGGVLLRWQTGFEVANLGFNLYRDDAGHRTRINPNLVAGSAFFVGANTVLGAGRSYVWRDTQGINPAAQYWLEEKDLNGNSFWHGPVMLSSVGKLAADSFEPNARLLSDLGDDQNADTATHTVERFATQRRVTAAALATQQALVGNSTIKITVNREGWYQIKVADLIAAGLDGRTNPQFLQLFVDGREQPINVTTNKDGSLTGIEFYGTGVDNPYTRERAYFLLVGASAGKRIPKVTSIGNPAPGGSFLATVERRDRSLYFSALRNGERENFFGAVIHEPVDQTLTLARVNSSAATAATLEVTLQGATNQAHSVRVELNGSPVGTLSFANQASAAASFNVAHALLREGANTVRLVPLGGPGDVALVDSLRLSYQHYNTADGEALRLTATGQQAVTIDGFSKPAIRVLDITDASAVQELVGVVQSQKSGNSVSLLVPGTGQRTLLALASDLASPVSVVASANSSWRQPLNGADLIVITRKEFAAALDPLVTLRQNQGLSVAVVDVEAVYNEFSFGQKTPQAMKDFLSYAATSWKKKPRYVLLAADASYDPKGYLGLGNSDLVPTKLFDTQYMETACDDYFVDFNNDGVPELAIGRLPARTANEALTMAAKILRYNTQTPADSLLLVSDLNDTFDFTTASESLRALIPPDVRAQSLHRGDADDATMHARLLAAINNGQRLVNYVGHGSPDLWRGSLLTSADVSSLTNSDRLTIFVMMTCLNGYYIDPASGSLGKDLLKSERGGAVAVWASSGMTLPDAQAVMNQEAYRQMFNSQGLTIGEAMKQAKVAITNGDVRRTWILLGDPTMKLR